MFTNRFSHLSVDEKDEAEDGLDIQIPGMSNNESLQFDLEMSMEEAIFAVMTFMEDVMSIREHVTRLWCDFDRGEIDLVTAAVTTNTALELLSAPHDDLVRRVRPIFRDNLDATMWAVSVIMKGVSSGDWTKETPVWADVPPGDDSMAEMYDFLLLPMVQIMNAQAEMMTVGSVPVYRTGSLGEYDPILGPDYIAR